MNKLFFVLAFFLPVLYGGMVKAATLDEINSRLEDIEDEITFQKDMQLYNQTIKNMQRQSNLTQQSAAQSKFISSNSMILRTDTVLSKDDKKIVVLRPDSIKALPGRVYLFTVLDERNIPQYDEELRKEYSGTAMMLLINCGKNLAAISGIYSYNRKLENVRQFTIPKEQVIFAPIKGGFLSKAKNYLCS